MAGQIERYLIIAFKAIGRDVKVAHEKEYDNGVDEHTVEAFSVDGIVLYPTTLVVKTIAGEREVPGYAIDVPYVYPATRDQPEDVDIRTMFQSQSLTVIINEFVKLWVENQIRGVLDYIDGI